MRQEKAKGQERPGIRKKRRERDGLVKSAGIWLGRILVLAVALLFLVWLGRQAYVFCIAQAIRTESVEWTGLTATYAGQAVIMRNETVVTAPATGSVAWLAAEGTMVHVGSVVARISSAVGPGGQQGQVDLSSPAAGDIDSLDGWEGILTPVNYQRMDLFALVDSVTKKSQEALADAQSGDPLFKIVDNLSDPYFVIKLDSKPDDLAIKNSVNLTWGTDGQAEGRVIGLQSRSGAYVVIVDVSQATGDAFSVRALDVKLNMKQGEGFVVPAQALVNNDNEQGVYTRTPLGIRFIRVEVAGSLGGMVALRAQDLQPGMDIVINPDLVKRIDMDK
jgi:putative membrane fusion protein